MNKKKEDKKKEDTLLIDGTRDLIVQVEKRLGISDEEGINAHPDRSMVLVLRAGEVCATACIGKSNEIAEALAHFLNHNSHLIGPTWEMLSILRHGEASPGDAPISEVYDGLKFELNEKDLTDKMRKLLNGDMLGNSDPADKPS